MSFGMQMLFLFFLGPLIITTLIIAYAIIRSKLDPKYAADFRSGMVRGRVKHSSKKEALQWAVVIAAIFLIAYVYDLFR